MIYYNMNESNWISVKIPVYIIISWIIIIWMNRIELALKFLFILLYRELLQYEWIELN